MGTELSPGHCPVTLVTELSPGHSPVPSPGNAALLDRHDPFLPLPEDSAVPAVPSLFTDLPPLQIDASDFQ